MLSSNERKCENDILMSCWFSVNGPTVINPSVFRFFFSKHDKISSIASEGKPCFCFSPLVFISSRTGIILFNCKALLLILLASFLESIESILSNVSTALFILFDKGFLLKTQSKDTDLEPCFVWSAS